MKAQMPMLNVPSRPNEMDISKKLNNNNNNLIQVNLTRSLLVHREPKENEELKNSSATEYYHIQDTS